MLLSKSEMAKFVAGKLTLEMVAQNLSWGRWGPVVDATA